MTKRFGSRWVYSALLVCILAGGAGIWALLHPGGMWLQHWRAEPSVVSSRFVFGPYPLEDDFRRLQGMGVSTIISLLDPGLPYEKILLDQEIELAQEHGMRVLNFPMASILGQSFGKDYLANSRAAARAAMDSKGVAYIHCYLGLHRARNVQAYLEDQAGVATATLTGTQESVRSADVLALDRANLAFIERHYEQSLRELAKIRVRNSQMMLLEAWSNYRLGRIDDARSGFGRVAAEHPDSADAQAGLGFCALQRGNLDAAEQQFKLVLSMHPDDPQTMAGLGHVKYRQGQLAQARSLFERVLERNPDDSEARESLKKLTKAP